MRHTGVLVQFDATEARLPPVERLRAAVAACVARRGWRPVLALVRPGGNEWPEEVDGVPIEPSPTVAYASWLFLVQPNAGE